eukprot:4884270-Ditylum_brightwellii.AAC.1
MKVIPETLPESNPPLNHNPHVAAIIMHTATEPENSNNYNPNTPIIVSIFQKMQQMRSFSHGSEEDQQQLQNHTLQDNSHCGDDNGVHGPGCECNPESAL